MFPVLSDPVERFDTKRTSKWLHASVSAANVILYITLPVVASLTGRAYEAVVILEPFVFSISTWAVLFMSIPLIILLMCRMTELTSWSFATMHLVFMSFEKGYSRKHFLASWLIVTLETILCIISRVMSISYMSFQL